MSQHEPPLPPAPPTGPPVLSYTDPLGEPFPPSAIPRTPALAPDRRLAGPAVALVAVGALAGNIALATSFSTVAASIAVVMAALLLVGEAGRRVADPVTRLSAAIAVGAGLVLPLRASTWLAFLNSATAAIALFVLALATSGMSFALSSSTLYRAISRGFHALYGVKLLGRSIRKPKRAGMSTRAIPIVRGLLVAAIPLLILVSLLASADPVFSAAITPDLSVGSLPEHVVRTFFVAFALAGLVAIGAVDIDEPQSDRRPLGAIEALVVLSSIAALFGAFAIVQLASALGQTDDILADQGVSHADYARNGYFQLLWVAAITAGLLGAVHTFKQRGSKTVDQATRFVGSGVAVLTCVIVASAIVRLDLYTDAFGQTTLRWYSNAFAWMLGIGFVMAAVAGVFAVARALPIGIVSLTAATLLIVNVLNAEARIAEHNLTSVDAPIELDADYLIGLSSDAWPVLLEHERTLVNALEPDRIGQEPRERFRRACDRAAEPFGFGPLGFNLSIARLDCAG